LFAEDETQQNVLQSCNVSRFYVEPTFYSTCAHIHDMHSFAHFMLSHRGELFLLCALSYLQRHENIEWPCRAVPCRATLSGS